MADRLLRLATDGNERAESAVTVSGGAADAGRIPALAADGKLDASVLRATGVSLIAAGTDFDAVSMMDPAFTGVLPVAARADHLHDGSFIRIPSWPEPNDLVSVLLLFDTAISNHVHPIATTTSDGFMSAAQVTALAAAGAGGSKYVTTLATAAASYTLTHNLNTKDVSVTVYDLNTGNDVDYVDKFRPTVNTVRLDFLATQAANTLRVIVRS